jgi:hypothetical protein
MVAAAATLWVTFGFWITAPSLGVGPRIARTAAGLLMAEFLLLLLSSYGCDGDSCTTPASVAVEAAHTDVPALTAVFLVVVGARAWRRAADG